TYRSSVLYSSTAKARKPQLLSGMGLCTNSTAGGGIHLQTRLRLGTKRIFGGGGMVSAMLFASFAIV
ncbi:hypothetical protein BDB00DRAFT_837307, partial [Zychaea mexicana]|uniref:uncharacterized protein n=1 Tax=Zychaea mexicana TaxID=64656 RepID=UPI0022FE71A9